MKNLNIPWKVLSPKNDSNAFDVYNNVGVIIHKGFWGGEAEARLFAAAPELLHNACALIEILEQNKQYGCFDGFGRRDQENTKAFFNRPEIKSLVNSINKAKGSL